MCKAEVMGNSTVFAESPRRGRARHTSVWGAALVAAWTTLSTSHTSAQPIGTPGAEPLTPASVALLAGRVDPGSIAKLRAAVTHESPTVRAIAARIAGIQRMGIVAPDLARALDTETDERAVVEQVRALLFIDSATWRETIERRFSATPPLALHAYVEWIVRNRPEMLADGMSEVFRGVPAVEVDRFSGLILAAIRQHPAMAERFLRGWLHIATGDAWRSVVDATGEAAREAEAAVLREALDVQNPDVRQETVWAIVSRLAHGQAVAPDVLAAALPRASAENAPVTWELVGREIVARIHRGVSTPDRAGFLKSEATRRRQDAMAASYLPQLTVSERSALREVLKDQMPEPTPAKRADPPKQPGTPTRAGTMPMRTVPIPWPGLLEDLLRQSNCTVTRPSRVGGFGLVFRPDGRPERADLARHELAPECDPVLGALARLTIAEATDTIVPGAMQTFALPLNEEYVGCATEVKQGGGPRPIASGKIEPPRKIRHVQPRYPAVAQQKLVQGVVVIEGTISRTGCMLSLVVLRSVHPLLDMEAIQTVSGWRFTPTLLGGEPVPVILTVTVNFKLE